MEKHELIDIVGRGSKVRKSINSHLIIGENTPEYDRGDILDANATAARITSKVEEAKTYLKNYVDNNHKPVSDKFFYQTIDGEKVLVYIDPETGEKTYFGDENDNAIIVVDPSVPTFSIGATSVGDMENLETVSASIDAWDFDEVVDNAPVSGDSLLGKAITTTVTPTVDSDDNISYRFDYTSFSDGPLVKYYSSNPTITRIFDQGTGEFYIKVSVSGTDDYFQDATNSAYKSYTESIFSNTYVDSNHDYYKVMENYTMQKIIPTIDSSVIAVNG